jgi:hypothetical protein
LKASQKIASFFLLGIFAFHVLFLHLYFSTETVQLKNRMSETIMDLSSLEKAGLIQVPVSELGKYTGSEIIVNDRMYDVVKREVKGDVVNIYVLNDNDEEDLVQQLGANLELAFNKLVHPGSADHPVKNLTKDTFQKYFSVTSSITVHPSAEVTFSAVSDRTHSDPFSIIFVPPPQA